MATLAPQRDDSPTADSVNLEEAVQLPRPAFRRWLARVALTPSEAGDLQRRLRMRISGEGRHRRSEDSVDVVPGLARAKAVLPPAEFCARMSWSKQALSKALTEHRVFHLEHGGGRFFPAFFADPRYARRQLFAVSRKLGDLPGGAKWLFLTTPSGELGGMTPLQGLAAGRLTDVLELAEAKVGR
jgi:hypothetical protein